MIIIKYIVFVKTTLIALILIMKMSNEFGPLPKFWPKIEKKKKVYGIKIGHAPNCFINKLLQSKKIFTK